jgi:hypothetical protein
VEEVSQARVVVESLTQRAEEVIATATGTVAAALTARMRADATLAQWLSALDAALARLERARERLARAESAYQAARSAYNHAKADLSSRN